MDQTFHAVIDNVSSAKLYDARTSCLKSGGWFIQVGTGPLSGLSLLTTLSRVSWPTYLNAGRQRYYFVQQKNSTEYFEQIGKWMTEGKLRAVVDEKFEWKDVPAALAKLREGRAKGKILIRVQ